MTNDSRKESERLAELREFLTLESPLGPFRHDKIMRKTNNPQNNILLNHVGLFDNIISRGAPIIMGRRGSGKTAVVNAFLAAAGHVDLSYSRGSRNKASRDIYIFINSWDHLDELVEKVGREVHHSMGDDPDWSAVLPETVARKWSSAFWHLIFQQIYRESRERERNFPTSIVDRVGRYITGRDFLAGQQTISNETIEAAVRDLRKLVCKYFVEDEIQCFIIIDSLELYPVESPKFLKVISGFLKCINEFNDDNPHARIICCVPEEIEHILIAGSSNKLKDLTGAASLSRLKWRPIDLLRIVAERYRDFLRIHGHDDKKFVERIDKLNFSERKSLRSFFDEVLPTFITNRFGQRESTLAYLVRHTQLLPREFILLFNRAIMHSHAEHGSWRSIEQDAIVKAVQDQEPELAGQILGPYQPLYPELIRNARAVISELRPIFTKSDADKLGGRLRSVKSEVEDPWSMLFDIGVIGYIDNPHEGRVGEVYEYARFHYNSSTKLTLASNRRYCVHPVFSGTWGLRLEGRGDKDKFIYPADVGTDIWET